MKNLEHWAAKELIVKFIENPNWNKEIKIAYKLLYKSPDLESWLSLSLPIKISSLSFFLTKEGELYCPESCKNPYLLDLQKLRPKTKSSVDFVVN